MLGYSPLITHSNDSPFTTQWNVTPSCSLIDTSCDVGGDKIAAEDKNILVEAICAFYLTQRK